MNKKNNPIFAALVAAGVALTPAPSRACGFNDLGSCGQGAIDVGKGAVRTVVQGATHVTGEAVKTVAKIAPDNTTKAILKAEGNTIEATGHSVDATTQALKEGADDTKKAAQQDLKNVGKAVQDVGHGAKEVGKFVEKHPWETVAAVALIAGGGYLIVYQGYALSVSVGVEGATVVIPITGGTAVAAGSTLAIAGVGEITVASMQSTADPASPEAEGSSQTSPTAAQTETNSPTIQSYDGANQQSILFHPWLPNQSSDWNKLDYAYTVSKWAEQMNPIDSFDPARSPLPTQSETKIIDALTNLYAIQDSEGAKMAKEQAEESHHVVENFILDQVKDKAKEEAIKIIAGSAAATAYSITGNVLTVISPVVVADDGAVYRDELIKKLEHQLDAYKFRRNPNAPLIQPMAPITIQPQPPQVEMRPN